MTFVRRHLYSWAVAMLSLQCASAGLLAAGVCCATESDRTHEQSAVECPMHQPANVSADEHAHHDRVPAAASSPAAPSTAQMQMTCDCGSDAALVPGPVGLVSEPLSLSISSNGALLAPADRPQPMGLAFSPPSPPPRQQAAS